MKHFTEIPKSAVLLLSGGLDSVTLLYALRGEGCVIHPLLIDYQQPHLRELVYAEAHCRRFGLTPTRLTIPALGGLSESGWIVPFRNGILISLAVNLAVHTRSEVVCIGCNAGDAEMFPDCRRSFLGTMTSAIDWAGYPDIGIYVPFLLWNKARIGGLAREIGVPTEEIWSCYTAGPEPCGRCPACLKLKEAFA